MKDLYILFNGSIYKLSNGKHRINRLPRSKANRNGGLNKKKKINNS